MCILTSDFEVTTFATGNPYSIRNKAVCLGWKINTHETSCHYEFDELPDLDNFDLCVFFNAKFDLSWYRRLGFKLPEKVWCCQLAEYYLNNYKTPYPSLDDCAIKYNLGKKIDVIKLEYWDKGVDTDAIPRSILSEYCCMDVDLTYAIYLRQQEAFVQRPGLFKLFKLACQDLLILQEMEHNGLIYDEELCKQRTEELQVKHDIIYKELVSVYPDIPINFGSGDQLSAFLYGGIVKEEVEEHVGFYKTGLKKGQPKYANKTIKHVLPRLVEPLPKTELKKAGVWQTSVDVLSKLKGPAAKKYVGPLLEMSKLGKLLSTYYKGLPKINAEKDWPKGKIHGQYNQCVTATSRLSASQPNQQNLAGDILDIFISRYND